MTIVLSSGVSVPLIEQDSAFGRLVVGLDWDANGNEGPSLDAFAFPLRETGKVQQGCDGVSYMNLSSTDGALALRCGEICDDEFIVDFAKIPHEITRIVFVFSIFPTIGPEPETFKSIESVSIRILNPDSKDDIFRYDLDEDVGSSAAVMMGEIYRDGLIWNFKARGEGFLGGIDSICKELDMVF